MENAQMTSKKRVWIYILFCLIPLAGGGLSGLVSMEGMKEFSRLAQPPLSPPALLFPIAWTVLYLLMGVGAAMVYLNEETDRKPPLTLFALQLGVNLLWSPLFFALKLRFIAFIWLLVLLGLAGRMAWVFKKVRPAAGYLQIPYLLWLVFAAYLNFGTWLLNRGG